MGISLVDTESEKPVGIINDYISLASGCLGVKNGDGLFLIVAAVGVIAAV